MRAILVVSVLIGGSVDPGTLPNTVRVTITGATGDLGKFNGTHTLTRSMDFTWERTDSDGRVFAFGLENRGQTGKCVFTVRNGFRGRYEGAGFVGTVSTVLRLVEFESAELNNPGLQLPMTITVEP